MDVREKLEVIAHLGDHITYKEDIGICYDSELAKVIEDTYMTLKNGVTVQECAEWEEIEDDWNMETIYKCSACKEEFVTIDGTPADNLWNYCPHCGAKMMPQPPKGE